jgi:hypothetical protein
VFSDGSVWPSVRVEEAWRDGLDAIAITDHIEYKPHKADVSTNHVRSYELAESAAEALGILLVKSAEITRGEPPGHWNALFLTELDSLGTNDYRVAVKSAAEQGAFIFWNHPGWKQPFNQPVWYAEQAEVYERGWLHGAEVVNGDEYNALVHKWCLEKNLTMLGNSDAHQPIALDYDSPLGEHRPVTLVFAREKSVAAIKEALLARRTAVYTQNLLVGKEEFLQPLFQGSIEVRTPRLTIKNKDRVWLQVFNRAPLNFELERRQNLREVTIPAKVTLHAGKTSLISVTGRGAGVTGERELVLPFQVTNLKVAPTQGLSVGLKAQITFKK